MRAIKITTNNEIFDIELKEPYWETIAKELNCLLLEIVPNQTDFLGDYLLLCDEEGLFKNLEPNFLTTYITGNLGEFDWNVIVGDTILVKNTEDDITGLTDKEVSQVTKNLMIAHGNLLYPTLRKIYYGEYDIQEENDDYDDEN